MKETVCFGCTRTGGEVGGSTVSDRTGRLSLRDRSEEEGTDTHRERTKHHSVCEEGQKQVN